MFNQKEYGRKWRAAHPEKAREKNKRWRAANPEKVRENQRKWRAGNPEKAREKNRRWRVANPEKVREASRKYHAAHPEKIREATRKYRAANPKKVTEQNKKSLKTFREKNRDDPIYRMHQNMRSGMSGAVKGTHKSASTMKIIGCTVEELFEHLESCASWEPWMTRERYGVGGWDVDHIIPIKQWEDKCPLQFALCWDKSNLQPMEHIKNIKKGAKIIYVDFTSPKT